MAATATRRKIGGLLLLAGLLGGAAAWLGKGGTADTEPGGAEGGALRTCQLALRLASRPPAQAEIPDIRATRDGSVYRFAWDGTSGKVRLGDGGPSAPARSALCVVEAATMQVESLVVDGTPIVAQGR